MGRFYQPVQADFIDNFLYRPPWEMAASVVGKKEQQIGSMLQSLNLMENVPIDFWKDYDKDTVEKIRSDISNKVDDIVGGLREDVLNSKYQGQIGSLQKELLNRFETGDISNVIESAKNYRDLEEKLKTMSPFDADRIRKSLVTSAIDESQGMGSRYKVFNPGTIYNSRDLSQEYIKERLASGFLKPDMVSTDIDESGRGYIKIVNTTNSGLKKEKIAEDFKQWLSSKSDFQDYASFAEKVYGEKFYDNKGNLDWTENSSLDKYLKNVEGAAFKQSSISIKEKQVDPLQVKQQEESSSAEASSRVDNLPPSISKTNLGQKRTTAVASLMNQFGLNTEWGGYIIRKYGSYSAFLTAANNGKVKYEDFNFHNSKDNVLKDKNNFNRFIYNLAQTDRQLTRTEGWSVILPMVKNQAEVEAIKKNANTQAKSEDYNISLGTQGGSGDATSQKMTMTQWATQHPETVIKQYDLPKNAVNIKISYIDGTVSPIGMGEATAEERRNNTQDLPTSFGVKITYNIKTEDGDIEVENGTEKDKVYSTTGKAYAASEDFNVLGNYRDPGFQSN